MVTELGTLVVVALILGVVCRAILGAAGASVPGFRRRRGGGSGWGIFFADLAVRFATTVTVGLARLVGRVSLGIVRLGQGGMERTAGRQVARRSYDLSAPPERPGEPRSGHGRGDAPVDDDGDYWEDD